MRTLVDLLQIGLALTLPVLLVLAVAKRRQRDNQRNEDGEVSLDVERSETPERPSPVGGLGKSIRRPGGAPSSNTINLGQDRELARTVIAALETRGVRVKLSERRSGGPNGGPSFEIRYDPADEEPVRQELQRAFDVDG